MIPLLLSALVALTVIIERIMTFRKQHVAREIWTEILRLIQSNRFHEASKICQENLGPITAVLLAGIREFTNPIEQLELAMKNQAEAWIPQLEKRIEILDTVITAAPLMGLLGTITGMMGSFQILTEKGINEPNAITGGVAEALIATAAGLMIALVCLVAYNYLNSRVKTSIYEIESAASELLSIRMHAGTKLSAATNRPQAPNHTQAQTREPIHEVN